MPTAMLKALFPLVILASLCAAAEPEQAAPLFDGQTLSGWEGDTKTFRVEDGAIVGGTLKDKIPHNTFLCTEKKYGDFELRLKFKLLGKEANGGVQFRS